MLRPRALFKISVVGVYRAAIPSEQFSSECLPPIRSLGLTYLIALETSYYTNKQYKALKCLDAYHLMVSGFVASVQVEEIAGKIVMAKVRNSQKMNDPLVNIWITEKCPSQLSSGKIFWKLLTVKQQTGIQDIATVHLI